jgi:hypothetical protein
MEIAVLGCDAVQSSSTLLTFGMKLLLPLSGENGHVIGMDKTRNTCLILWGHCLGKISVGRSSKRWEDNLKTETTGPSETLVPSTLPYGVTSQNTAAHIDSAPLMDTTQPSVLHTQDQAFEPRFRT